MTALLVIHHVGDAAGASRWRPLAAGWPGPSVVPDLPGHGGAPAPVGAYYAPGDAALVAVRALADAGLDGDAPVVVGHGWGAFAAELLAAASRVSGLVLVDGLGGPWATFDDLAEGQNRWLRSVFADPAAMGAPPADALDPRLLHDMPSVWERSFTEARRAAITVPVLALETPASPTPMSERDARVGAFAGEARCGEITDASPEAVRPHLATLL